MSDQDLKEELREIREHVAYLAELTATQHSLLIRVMAHNQAHLAIIRDSLIRNGADRTMLDQQLLSAYDAAIGSYHDHYAKYEQSGDVRDLLDGPPFPDPTQSN